MNIDKLAKEEESKFYGNKKRIISELKESWFDKVCSDIGIIIVSILKFKEIKVPWLNAFMITLIGVPLYFVFCIIVQAICLAIFGVATGAIVSLIMWSIPVTYFILYVIFRVILWFFKLFLRVANNELKN